MKTQITTHIGCGLLLAALLVSAPGLAQAKDDSDSTTARIARLEAAILELRAVNALQQVEIQKVRGRATDLESALAAVKGNPALALGPYVSVQTGTINLVKGPHIIFEGVNVHIRSGSGSTYDGIDPATWTPDMPTSGRGNLIIGYNEISKYDPTVRGGAHCLAGC